MERVQWTTLNMKNQAEVKEVLTMVTTVKVGLSATTLTGSRWCRGMEKVRLDPLVQCATFLLILLVCL